VQGYLVSHISGCEGTAARFEKNKISIKDYPILQSTVLKETIFHVWDKILTIRHFIQFWNIHQWSFMETAHKMDVKFKEMVSQQRTISLCILRNAIFN
jgi:hypothetical protein